MMETVVLGAGVTGLAAAYRLRQHGLKASVFEASHRAGGLLAPLPINGFTFDTAVHLSFASEPDVRAIFDQTSYITHKPESLCWDDGLWLKHPAQTNMFPLSVAEKTRLIAGLASNPEAPVHNYRDWLIQQYGEPIAARWPLVYTEKYWTIPAERLGTAWIGQRMRKADLGEVISGAISAETPNHYYVQEMRYPKRGGYGAFLSPLLGDADISYGHACVQIDPRYKSVRFANGRELAFRHLISTLPLPSLIDMIEDVPADIKADAASLFATSIDLISIGFRRPKVSPALWFYIYDREIWAARAYSPDWKSPSNVPEGTSALQFEIYSSREKPRQASVAELKRNTIEGLRKMGLAQEKDIMFVEHHHIPYGNVVFDIGMEGRRDHVRDWVEAQGIILAGRFGKWEYLWSNQAFMSGMAAADVVRNERAEAITSTADRRFGP